MARLARQGKRSQRIRDLAVRITTAGFLSGRGLQQKDEVGEARRLHAFVRDDVRYVKDPRDIELLHHPVALLDRMAGDCDDKAILLSALLETLGHETRFVAVAFAPDQFTHVWLQDRLNGRWVDLETTEPVPFGASVPTTGAVAFLEHQV